VAGRFIKAFPLLTGASIAAGLVIDGAFQHLTRASLFLVPEKSG
jgi:hypothetical protein